MNQNVEYQYGIKIEKKVIDFLGLTPSSKEDNINLDIDAWDSDEFSYSIKCQHTALKTGNLAFELATTDKTGKSKPSWFKTGRADTYLIVVGNALYAIDRNVLSEYVREYGWDRVVGLTLKTQQSQRDIGHSHVDAKLGIISIKQLKKSELIIKEWNLPF